MRARRSFPKGCREEFSAWKIRWRRSGTEGNPKRAPGASPGIFSWNLGSFGSPKSFLCPFQAGICWKYLLEYSRGSCSREKPPWREPGIFSWNLGYFGCHKSFPCCFPAGICCLDEFFWGIPAGAAPRKSGRGKNHLGESLECRESFPGAGYSLIQAGKRERSLILTSRPRSSAPSAQKSGIFPTIPMEKLWKSLAGFVCPQFVRI